MCLAATVIAFNKLEEDEIKNKIDKEEKQAMDLESQEVKYRSFRQIVNNFYNEEVETIDDDKEVIVKSKEILNQLLENFQMRELYPEDTHLKIDELF